MVAPYRGGGPDDAGRIQRGDVLATYALGRELRAPFVTHDSDGSLARGTEEGFAIAMRKPTWSCVYQFSEFPLSDISARAAVQCTGHPQAQVLLYARCFEIGETRLFYAAAFKPGLGQHRLCRYVDNRGDPLTSWTATEALGKAGETNELELRVAADLLVVLVNGEVVQEHRDRSFGIGHTGIELWGHEAGDRFLVERVEIARVD